MTTEQLILVADVETTGFAHNPATKHPDVIELAWQKLTDDWFKVINTGTFVDITVCLSTIPSHAASSWTFNQRYKPQLPIAKAAFDLHGIPWAELQNCPSHLTAKLPDNVNYLIAHNATFDHKCLGSPDCKLICTKKLATKFKKAFNIPLENVQLDYLVTYFYPDRPELIKMHHDALNDVCKTILLLAALVKYTPKIDSFDKLYEIQEML